jgi:PEP-CTERM motif
MKFPIIFRRTIGYFGLAACATLAMGGMSTARAQAVTLQSLIASNGTIQVGDKLFSDFNLVSTSGFPSALDILVKGEVTGGLNGIEFDAPWHTNPGQAPQTANITYNVSVLAPGWYISDIHLDTDVSLIGGAGQSLVKLSASDVPTHTTVLPAPTHLLQSYQLVGQDSVLNPSANTTSLQNKLIVETTILQSADSVGSNPSVLHIQESFSQAVPEPSTYAMSVLGLGVMGLLMRRKTRQAA